jgi:hypothetical protein
VDWCGIHWLLRISLAQWTLTFRILNGCHVKDTRVKKSPETHTEVFTVLPCVQWAHAACSVLHGFLKHQPLYFGDETVYILFFVSGATAHSGPWLPLLRFLLRRHAVGLGWMSHQPVAKAFAYTGQHNTETQKTNIHTPGGIRTHDPSNQAAKTYALVRAATGTGWNCILANIYMYNLSLPKAKLVK